ncbi:MAG TPA: hypothetical protein PLV25_07395, partial [Opitutales bacterium]|nr:hypothetical protein [Opitutales bacterium]
LILPMFPNPQSIKLWLKKDHPWSIYIYVAIALAGLTLAISTVIQEHPARKKATPDNPPPRSPFSSTVAGAGIIESNTENILIGTPLPGIIYKIYVKPGEIVSANAPLFLLDPRAYLAQREQLTAAVEVAQAQLELLKMQPRPETVPPQEAKVQQSQSSLAEAKLLWDNVAPLEGTGAIGEEALLVRKLGYQLAQAQLQEQTADLSLLLAGAWKPDIDIAQANLDLAKANLNAVNVDLERIVVRAPVAGTVLRINTHLGEYAPSGVLDTPLIVFGNTHPLNVRVDIDDKNVPLFSADEPAYAVPRGATQIKYPLKFVRIEPYVVPKQNLTGATTELVDTRVFQVIYSLPEDVQGLYVGQQMDVFIQGQH